MGSGWMTTARKLAIAALTATVFGGGFAAWYFGVLAGATMSPGAASAATAGAQPTSDQALAAGATAGPPVLELEDKQLELIKIATVSEQVFPLEQDAVGSIDFNEDMVGAGVRPIPGQDHLGVRPGRRRGAEGSAAVSRSTVPICCRPEFDADRGGGDLRSEQSGPDSCPQSSTARRDRRHCREGSRCSGAGQQVSAEGALKAARDAVRIFGKTDAEIDNIVAQRGGRSGTGGASSPIAGRVTARNAAARAARAARQCAGAVFGGRSLDHVDAGERHRNRQSRYSGSARQSRSRSWPIRIACSTATVTTVGATVDPNLAHAAGAFGSRRIPSTICAPACSRIS